MFVGQKCSFLVEQKVDVRYSVDGKVQLAGMCDCWAAGQRVGVASDGNR